MLQPDAKKTKGIHVKIDNKPKNDTVKQSNNNEKDNSSLIIITLLVLIVLILIGTAYMIFTNNNTSEVQPTTDSVIPTTNEPINSFGFFINSIQKNEKNYLQIKTAKLINADNPDYSKFCGESNEKCPNDYFIDTSSSELLELIVDEKTQINVIYDYSENCLLKTDENVFKKYTISYDELITSNCNFAGNSSYAPFEFSYRDNILIQATQFYIP